MKVCHFYFRSPDLALVTFPNAGPCESVAPPPGNSSGDMRVLAAIWIGGGALVGLAALAYLWRSNLSQPFLTLAVGGGLLLVLAAIWLAAAVAARGSWLAIAGLLAVAVGVGTGFFGGLILVPPGVVLYIVGVYRVRVVEPRALGIAVFLLVLAVAMIPAGADEIVGIELAAVAAIATGFGVHGFSPARRQIRTAR